MEKLGDAMKAALKKQEAVAKEALLAVFELVDRFSGY
jgi:hypothetical protein